MSEITISYYLDNRLVANRYRGPVPRVGDEVRVNGACYPVILVVWIEDEGPDPRVNIGLARNG
ncbi:hypothetical protein [Pseudomonas helleri]|uniref:hypothetical protein n=1 Tax=Pseudomonas helleri TaxID=1608996 RepID=UPI003F956970